ncbi:hypothetical protein HDU96_007378 [Phlyctochytrium bullatum]|nr:hypothetical protein HDU96_007378 [Phlyctochytrium bullatum]
MSTEFDRIIAKSSLCMKLEEENNRLRQEVLQLKSHAPVGGATGTSPSANRKYPQGARAVSAGSLEATAEPSMTKAEETIRAYESRIRNLEKLLQESYSNLSASKLNASKEDITALKANMIALQNENKELYSRLSVAESHAAEAESRLREISITADERVREANSRASDALSQLEVQEERIKSLKKELEEPYNTELNSLKGKAAILEKENAELRNASTLALRERSMLLSELDRISNFMKEVYSLLDSCSKAIVSQDTSMPNSDPPVPLNSLSPALSTPTQALPLFRPQAISLSQVKSATPDATSPPLASPSPRTSVGGSLPLVPTLGNLRNDEKEIRRRLRELEDDIRCQTLELDDLKREVMIYRMPPTMETSGGEYDYRETGSSMEASDSLGLRLGGTQRRVSNAHHLDSGLSNPTDSVMLPAENASDTQNMNAEVERLTAIIAELTSQISTLQAQLETAAKDIESANSRASNSVAEASRLEDVINDFKQKIASSNSEIIELRNTVEICRVKEADYRKRISEIELLLKQKQDEVLLSLTSLGNMANEISTLRKELDEARRAAESLRSERENYSLQLNTIQVQLENTASHSKRLSEDVNEKQNTLASKDSELYRIRQALERTEAQLEKELLRSQTLSEENHDWRNMFKLALDQLSYRDQALLKIKETLMNVQHAARDAASRLEDDVGSLNIRRMPVMDANLLFFTEVLLAQSDIGDQPSISPSFLVTTWNAANDFGNALVSGEVEAFAVQEAVRRTRLRQSDLDDGVLLLEWTFKANDLIYSLSDLLQALFGIASL